TLNGNPLLQSPNVDEPSDEVCQPLVRIRRRHDFQISPIVSHPDAVVLVGIAQIDISLPGRVMQQHAVFTGDRAKTHDCSLLAFYFQHPTRLARCISVSCRWPISTTRESSHFSSGE